MRVRTVSLWTLGILLGLPCALLALALIFANTGPGRRVIEREAASLTGGQVVMSGFGGRFPDSLRLAHLTLRDRSGVWLSADGLAVDWSPIALLEWTARIDGVSIERIRILRAPLPGPPRATTSPGGGAYRLPISIDLRRLALARIDLDGAFAGAAAALRIDGAARLESLQAGQLRFNATRLDALGTYVVNAVVDGAGIHANVSAHEPAGGLIAAAAKLPALGPLAIDASVTGPQQDERVQVAASAGELHLSVSGMVNVVGRSATLDLNATAPAMRPRTDFSWQSVDIAAHVTGRFDAPNAQGRVQLVGLSAAGAQVASVQADVSGTQGYVNLHAVMSGMRLPGAQGALFAASPIDLTGDIALQEPGRPVSFRLSHALLSLVGSAKTDGDIAVTITTTVPEMAPLAALAKVVLQGPLTATAQIARHGDATDVAIHGDANFVAGQAPVASLLGRTQFAVEASLDGQDIRLKSAAVNGRALRADVAGTDENRQLNLAWHVSLPDLSALAPRAVGRLTGTGQIAGHETGINIVANISGEAGLDGFVKAPVTVRLSAENLPNAPSADLQVHGALAGGAFVVLGDVRSDAAGALHAVLHRADWKSLTLMADISVSKNHPVPLGNLDLKIGHLADLAALFHAEIDGALNAKLVSASDSTTLQMDGSGFSAGSRRLDRLALVARADGSVSDPTLSASLNLDGIEAEGVTGQARITTQGKTTALGVDGTLDLDHLDGAPAKVAMSAVVNGVTRKVVLRSTVAHWKTLTLRQDGSTHIDLGSEISLDRLALSLNQARLSLSGRISPSLNLTASIQNVTPDLATPFLPGLAADGVISANAHLMGTTGAPLGHVSLVADALRLRGGMTAAVPPARIRMVADLHGQSATVNAQMSAGPRFSLGLDGDVPLQPDGAMAVRSVGTIDLALLNPVLEAEGRNATGKATVDFTAGGTVQAPSVRGAFELHRAAFQDFAKGLQLTNIDARINADGTTLQISRFSASAGPGTIDLAGSVGVLAAGHPVDLKITARHARPLASDLVSAQFDADLILHGSLDTEISSTGKVLLRRVDINVPDSLPPGVAVLHVRRPGARTPAAIPAAAPGPRVKLDVAIDAPGNIFVRGHGLDAELGGKLSVKGSTVAPQIDGGFDLRRGNFSLAGTSLSFSKGTVSFDGTGVTGRIDPMLNFEADSTQGSVTATLKLTGYADAPKIVLSSVPELPQDEVLAQLLFGQSLKQLSALQIAEIGSALAELSGITGSSDPLSSIRKGLGLDRLSVGAGINGAGASVEAGRYVANGVYVGAKQATGGAGGTQAQVQVDLTRHLKLQTTLGTGGGSAQGATPQNDPGSSIGLSYQFEY